MPHPRPVRVDRNFFVVAVSAVALCGAVACGDGDENAPVVDAGPSDTRISIDSDTAGATPDGGMCAPKAPRRIDCRDRVESNVVGEWGVATDDENVQFSRAVDAIFGEHAVRLRVDGRDTGSLVWSPVSPVDIRSDSDGPPVLRVAVRGEPGSNYGWQGATPKVTLRDDAGQSVTLVPPRGNDELLPADGSRWRWLHVPIAERRGWRVRERLGDSLDELDLSSIASVGIAFDTWGRRFTVDLDGLAFTGPNRRCAYDCPADCNGRGVCAPSALRCRCEMGAVGPACGECGEGFVPDPEGGCELAADGSYDEWPNPASDATGDAWLRAHHREIEVLRPRVLVLNFANDSSMPRVESLVRDIIGGFEEASTPAELGPDATPQLQYEVAKYVDLRDGRAGNDPAPDDWPYPNSTKFPRKELANSDLRFHYAELFSRRFANYYDWERSDDSKARPRLCELVERGEIHDVWIVGAASENDASAAEVLEYKQRYTARGNPVPGSFSPCAGNGCFRAEIEPCDRSVRVGFINYQRGPGCYLHNIGHLMEWMHSHRVVPSYSRWFDRYAAMDLPERYDVPFESLYAVQCRQSPCISYPDASSVEIRHRGETYRIDDWDHVCGNCHFPPNGIKHYDYDNSTPAATTCDGFARRAVSCREDASSRVTRDAWRDLRAKVPDCGGGFLVWWYRRMPAHGTSHSRPSGKSMKSVWPYLFY